MRYRIANSCLHHVRTLGKDGSTVTYGESSFDLPGDFFCSTPKMSRNGDNFIYSFTMMSQEEEVGRELESLMG